MTSNCIYCSSNKIKSLKKRILLGYLLMVVRWRLMYKLSLRDLSDMFLERGIQFSHETIRDWERKFSPLMINSLRKRRRGKME